MQVKLDADFMLASEELKLMLEDLLSSLGDAEEE
jgi:recombination associated protein RdgC